LTVLLISAARLTTCGQPLLYK